MQRKRANYSSGLRNYSDIERRRAILLLALIAIGVFVALFVLMRLA